MRAGDIDQHAGSWQRPLVCLHCEAHVGPVSSVIGETSRRAAHFRLLRHRRHEAGCAYDIPARITELVEASDGSLVRASGRYRLVLPATLAQHRPALPDRHANERADPAFTRRASALLNTAAKVSELIERHRADGRDISDQFSATCGGQPVPWDAFFFLPRSVWRLSERLDQALVTHPAAVAMKVQTAGTSRKGGSVFIEQPVPATWRDRSSTPHPRQFAVVRSAEPELLAPFSAPGTWVLALGMWDRFAWGSGRRVDVCLWIDSANQITAIAPPPSLTTARLP